MLMYHWYSQALADYGQGSIIVLAESPEQARERALNAYEEKLGNRIAWEDLAYRLKLINEFKADLAPDPKVVDVLLISGSM